MQNFSYLQPPSRVHSYAPADQTYIEGQSKIMNRKPRRVYSIDPSELNEEELQSLHRLKEYLKHKNPNKMYPDSLLLRYCHLGSFITSDSKDLFKYYEDWSQMEPCASNIRNAILHSGVFYCYGRDEKYCPTIYFHPNRIDFKDYQIQDYLSCLKILLTPVQQHMLVPGKIEKWNVVVDVRDFNDSQYRDKYQIIQKNFMKICYAYPFRLKRIFIIEKRYSTLWAASSKSDIVHQLINNLKMEKYCVRITHLKDLNRYIPASERERQYGGQLQDVCEFWPIRTTNKLVEQNSKFQQLSQDSYQYESIDNENNAEYFAEMDEKKARCDLKQICNIF